MPVQTDGCVLRQPKISQEFSQKDVGQSTKIMLSYILPARHAYQWQTYESVEQHLYIYIWKKKKRWTHLVVQSRCSRVTNQPHRDPEPFGGCPELRALRKESIFSLSVCTASVSASGGLSWGCSTVQTTIYKFSPKYTEIQKQTHTNRHRSLTAHTHRFIQWLTGCWAVTL